MTDTLSLLLAPPPELRRLSRPRLGGHGLGPAVSLIRFSDEAAPCLNFPGPPSFLPHTHTSQVFNFSFWPASDLDYKGFSTKHLTR